MPLPITVDCEAKRHFQIVLQISDEFSKLDTYRLGATLVQKHSITLSLTIHTMSFIVDYLPYLSMVVNQ